MGESKHFWMQTAKYASCQLFSRCTTWCISLFFLSGKRKKNFTPALRGKGVVVHVFPEMPGNIWGSSVFFHVWPYVFLLSAYTLCWVLHTDLKWGKSKNVLTCYLFSSYNISLEALKNPGGIFFLKMLHSPQVPPYCLTQHTAPPIRVLILLLALYILTCWLCWHMNYSMITLVTTVCLLSSWKKTPE